jgi:hypothetical protein
MLEPRRPWQLVGREPIVLERMSGVAGVQQLLGLRDQAFDSGFAALVHGVFDHDNRSARAVPTVVGAGQSRP